MPQKQNATAKQLALANWYTPSDRLGLGIESPFRFYLPIGHAKSVWFEPNNITKKPYD